MADIGVRATSYLLGMLLGMAAGRWSRLGRVATWQLIVSLMAAQLTLLIALASWTELDLRWLPNAAFAALWVWLARRPKKSLPTAAASIQDARPPVEGT